MCGLSSPARAPQELQRVMKPLARAATLLPPAALRADPGVALTAFARYAPALLTVAPILRVCLG